MATPGMRLRLLLEWYGAELTEEQGVAYLEAVTEQCKELFPDAVIQIYAEKNPPADEVGHL